PRELGRIGADVVHGPDFSVPYLSRRPSVLTLHDLSPWMDERLHHAADSMRSRTPLLFDLGLATMVITPGEKVRRAAIERFRLAPERVVSVPEGAGRGVYPCNSAPGIGGSGSPVLSLRGYSRAAQESGNADLGVAGGAPPSRGRTGARG